MYIISVQMLLIVGTFINYHGHSDLLYCLRILVTKLMYAYWVNTSCFQTSYAHHAAKEQNDIDL